MHNVRIAERVGFAHGRHAHEKEHGLEGLEEHRFLLNCQGLDLRAVRPLGVAPLGRYDARARQPKGRAADGRAIPVDIVGGLPAHRLRPPSVAQNLV